MPGMVRPRRQGQAYLADNLGPHVKRGAGVLPFGEWKGQPDVVAILLLAWRSHDLDLPGAASAAVDKIDEGTPDTVEHIAGFVLSTAECLFDSRLGCADDA